MTARILVVDDEPAVNELVCDALHLAGFDTTSAEHGMQALNLLRQQRIDLAIIDVNMPIMSGYELLERIRSAGMTVPVIVLTARAEREDTRTSFGLGADDFVRKPFSIEELTLRVTAILRRTAAADGSARITISNLTIDDDAHEVRRGEEVVELSPTEYRLLSVLAAAVGRVLTREQLLAQVWGLGPGMESTVVETYISYLRRKLGEDVTIRTVRGVGYQLLDPRA